MQHILLRTTHVYAACVTSFGIDLAGLACPVCLTGMLGKTGPTIVDSKGTRRTELVCHGKCMGKDGDTNTYDTSVDSITLVVYGETGITVEVVRRVQQ